MTKKTAPADHRFRCGDIARIEGTDYDIEIAYAVYDERGGGRASWFGWPEETIGIGKLSLVRACSDEEHRAAVARWLDRYLTYGDHRRAEIERIYRPRAFWRALLDRKRAEMETLKAELATLELRLLEAQAGPEDS